MGNNVNHPCEICDFVAGTADQLGEHIKSGHMVTNVADELVCMFCTLILPRSIDLLKHVKMEHVTRNYKCDSCNYVTHKGLLLKAHIDSVHMNIKRYRCPSCDYATNYGKTMKRHILAIHALSRMHASSAHIVVL